jgi:formate/nitrite transporter FocA (FNT family)
MGPMITREHVAGMIAGLSIGLGCIAYGLLTTPLPNDHGKHCSNDAAHAQLVCPSGLARRQP